MMRDNDNYRNYGLRSNVTPLQNPALTSHDMVRNIKFRNVCNDFQDILKEDINKIRFIYIFFEDNIWEEIERSLTKYWDLTET